MTVCKTKSQMHADGKGVCWASAWQCVSAGALLVVPAGLHKGSANGIVDNATLVYKRGEWASPFIVLKGMSKVLHTFSHLITPAHHARLQCERVCHHG